MFKPKDQVVCTDDGGQTSYIQKDKIYTVSHEDATHVFLNGINFGFHTHRFQKITKNICTCTTLNLMIQGCKCGQIQRERI